MKVCVRFTSTIKYVGKFSAQNFGMQKMLKAAENTLAPTLSGDDDGYLLLLLLW